MQKFVFILSLLLFLNVPAVRAAEPETSEVAENATVAAENSNKQSAEDTNQDITVHMGYEKLGEINKLSLTAEEDDLYTDTKVVPMDKEMSDTERSDEDIRIFNDNEGLKLPALTCDNPALKQQILNFIYQKINKSETRSVIEKRVRALLVKNMQDFKEITNNEIIGKNAFNTRAAMMELRVNKHFPAQRVCESKGNEFDGFESIYAVIYEDEGYYKVIVTNFMVSPNKTDDATFIFNWQ